MELLAPVGGKETLLAALRSGADAVYFGAQSFNARRNAENFSEEEMKEAVNNCKLRGVKVYLTLNTLIYGDELKEALETAKMAARLGVDGLILADLGLAKLIHQAIPDMPLHASTQLTVHTPDALYLLKEMGFSRVVPSREMSFEELKVLTEKAHDLKIEVEVFIHGALCMSMSGGCLMSAYLGGRSGNRGLCAGTCRLPFSARNKADDFCLSLKDLCLIEHIDALQKIGVDSLKIEGRMKPPEYVAAAVSAYRERLDKGKISKEKFELLEGVFSRNGFTDGYFSGNRKDMFGIRSDENIALSREIKNQTHEFFRNEFQRVKIDAKFLCKQGEASSLILSDGKNEACVLGAVPQAAINRPVDKDFALSQIGKLGSTPYILDSFSAEIGENLSLRASELNELRRNAVSKLNQMRMVSESYKIIATPIPNFLRSKGKKASIIARFRSAEMLEGVNLEGVDAVILPAEQIEKAEQIKGVKIIADIPAGMSETAFIDKCFEKAKTVGAVYIRNLSGLKIAKDLGLFALCSSEMNVLNPLSAEVLSDLGADAITLSCETKCSDFERFSNEIPIGAKCYGREKLMLTRNCPINSGVGCKNCENQLTDRKGEKFPLYCRGGFAEIFNPRPTFLGDRINEFSALDFIILDFVLESQEEIEKVLGSYMGKNSYCPNEYTRGLFSKGVF